MNLFLEPQGFLGTGASMLADITLLAYVLLIVPAMLAGLYFARAGYHRPRHKWTMIIVTVVNWVLIIFLMMVAFRTDVAPNLGEGSGNPRYFLPAVHALFGAPAQLLATFIVLRMLWEDRQVAQAKKRGETDLQKYWFKAAKWMMWLTLVLWLVTSVLGVISYLTRYNVIGLPGGAVSAPAATQEVEEVETPVATDEIPAPAATEEVPPPAATEEADD